MLFNKYLSILFITCDTLVVKAFQVAISTMRVTLITYIKLVAIEAGLQGAHHRVLSQGPSQVDQIIHVRPRPRSTHHGRRSRTAPS